ncbi:MAG: metallophosphoesterase [Haloarculaceae archaeon]
MITVVSDTHGTDDHRLSGRALEAVRDADLVVHAGDFNTDAVLDAFLAEAGSLAGVTGNNDEPAVRERLPAQRVVDADGVRIVVVHGHEHTDTALSLLARQEDADLVVVGHSHRPGVRDLDGVTVLNPGSHAQPRRYRPGFATLEVDDATGTIAGELREPDGTLIERFEIRGDRDGQN